MTPALTEQMQEYLAVLHYCGSTKGHRFGLTYDGTRKGLVARGLLLKTVHNTRATYSLTAAGVEAAKKIPDPRRTVRDESIQKRLDDVRAGKW